MSRKGFTLAEILITLTVIGVVAALTIPTLLQKTNDAELKTALKRDYGILAAGKLIANNNGGSLANVAFSYDQLKNLFLPHFNYIKTCYFGEDCYSISRL